MMEKRHLEEVGILSILLILSCREMKQQLN